MARMTEAEKVLALIEHLRELAETSSEWAGMAADVKVAAIIAPMLAQIRGVNLFTADRAAKSALVAESKAILQRI